MTNEELQEIVAAVLQALATNSKTIEQLTAVAQMSDSDYLELDGGRKVSYATLLYGYLKTATFNNAMTNIINLMASLKGNAANLPGTELDKLYWRQSPIVLLSSMGEYYDGDDDYTPQTGDIVYDGLDSTGYQLHEKKATGWDHYVVSQGVLYVNKRTGKMYEWTGSQTAWRLIVNPGGGGGGSIVKDVKYENGYLVFTFDTEQGDEVVSVPVNFDASHYVPITRTVNGKALSQNITIGQSDISGLVAALAAKVSGIKVNNGETQTPTNGVVNLEIQGGSSVDVVDNLNSTDGTKALSAKQGKVLDEKIAGKQSTLTFDNAPTSGSNNPVKSGGIYTALQTLLSNITVGQNGNWYVGETDTGVKAQGPKGNSVVDGDTFEIVNNLIDGGEGDALSAAMGMKLKANIDVVQASLERLYAKLGNIAFWTAQDQEDAEPTPIDWSIPKVVLTVTNSITHGVVKYNGNVVSGSIQVDQGTTVNLLVEGETGYGIATAAATGATVVDNGNGTFTVSVKVDTTMSLTITGTAAALVTPSFVCSNDADALSMTGAAAAVGGTFVGTIAIEDDYFDGFTIESVKDGSDNDVTYTTSGNTITVANMPSVLVITAKATKVMKFYSGYSLNLAGSPVSQNDVCCSELIRLGNLDADIVWTHKFGDPIISNGSTNVILFYNKNKQLIFGWNTDKNMALYYGPSNGTSRTLNSSARSTLIGHIGSGNLPAYARAGFKLASSSSLESGCGITAGGTALFDVNNISILDTLPAHNITYNLTGVTFSQESAKPKVFDGDNFYCGFSVDSGKTLQSVTVTMDGVDISQAEWKTNKRIEIASVTGDLVVTITAS